MFLYEQHCDANKKPLLLSEEKIKSYLKEIPKWETDLDSKTITQTYKFKDYHQTLHFINTIAEIIHTENHHPNISFGYNICSISYSTHSANGITLFDFICAAKIEQISLQKQFKA